MCKAQGKDTIIRRETSFCNQKIKLKRKAKKYKKKHYIYIWVVIIN